MKKSRRQFLETSLKLGVGLPLFGSVLLGCETGTEGEQTASTPVKPLKILILGGTSFLGPHQIAYAMKRGHSITTFTRGKSKPMIHQDLFEKVEQLIGDREKDLSALENRKWDVVIDNSGHNVEWTKASAMLLRENVGLYVYTSSTGVYYPYLDENMKENKRLLMEEPEEVEDEEMKIEYWYGVMKTNSEITAKQVFGEGRTIVVRPTYMIGTGDNSDRFIHWAIRLNRGGKTLVPGKKEDKVQFIDVRDVAKFMIDLIEKRTIGTFNAVGPEKPMTMPEFVKEAHSAFDSDIDFVYVDDYDFLAANGIKDVVPWIMPIGNNKGSALINNELAIKNGLTFTPLKQTVRDTFDWWMSDEKDAAEREKYENNPKNLLMREGEILKKWK
jgi:2'-hydroxyisoflavone reductase